ncbi:MAG TPA: FtsX-like permease family protein, partial [Terriglobales bacterium]
GGGLGILFAFWGTQPLSGLVPEDLRNVIRLTVDGRVLAFTALASVLAAIAFGLTPALQGSRFALTEALREGGQSSTPGRHGAQRILVVAESALAVVLLVSAGLLLKSFLRLTEADEGFDPTRVVTLNLSLPAARYSNPAERNRFVERMLEGVSALPGVRSASAVTRLPLGGGESRRGIEIEGRPARPGDNPGVLYSVASPGYFGTLGIPLLRGRDFTSRDDAGAPGVFIINQAMARAYWPGTDPVGKRMRFDDATPWSEVVGVAGDTRQQDLAEPAPPMFYAPYAQDSWPSLTVAIRAAGDPGALENEAERAIQAVDKDQAVYDVRTMSEVIENSVSPRRFYVLLLGIFAALALGLAAIGIYGVMAYSFAQRTHEIGIRLAVGAQHGDVLRLVLGEGARLALGGLAIGLVGALGLTRLLSSLLFGVSASDPLTYASVAVVLVLVALIACYVPARRALRVDPMVALRYE